MKNNKLLILLFIIMLFINSAVMIVLSYIYSVICLHMFGVILFQAIFITISFLLIKSNALFKYRAVRDSLTDIYNREHFFEELNKELSRSKRENESLSFILFDIDDFKHINDTHGHYVGDKILIELSNIINGIIRDYDIFGRLGGEEFALVLTKTKSKQEALDIAERIRRGISQYKFCKKIHVSVSIGITLSDSDDDEHSLYQKADDAMFKAKRKGKDGVVYL